MVQFVAWSSLVAGKRYTDRAGGRASGGGWREPVVHPFGRFRRVSPPHPRPARPRATYYGASAIIPRFRFRSMNGNASPRLASRLLLLPASANAPLRARSARAPCGGSPDGRRPPSTSTRTTSSTVRFGCKYGLIVETRATLWSSQIRVRLKEVLAAAIFLNSLDYHLDFENI